MTRGQVIMPGALDGITVLDLTTVLMGPITTQLLGDFGAEVIKVEAPGGDGSRYIGPMRNRGMGAGFLHSNRNKRSIVIDLKKPLGVSALMAIVAKSDIVVTNVRPKSLKRLGLGHEAFCKVQPQIITSYLVGYGQDGPYADKPAYDDLIQGALGIPSILAKTTGSEGRPYLPLTLMDRGVAHIAANAIIAALVYKLRTGRGQSLEIPMFESMAPLILGDHMGGETFIEAQGEMGYPRLLAPERQAYATLDGHICLLLYNDKHWQRYFEQRGEPNRMLKDERFRDIGTRTTHASSICQMLAAEMKTRTTKEWLKYFEDIDVPVMPLNTLEDLLTDSHLNEVGFFSTFEHPTEGTIRSMAPVGKWSESPAAIRRQAPILGEHSQEILEEVGLESSTIQTLFSEGAVQGAMKTAEEERK